MARPLNQIVVGQLLLEQLNYNLLFRWFVGLSPDDPIWHPTTFTKNRERPGCPTHLGPEIHVTASSSV